MAQKIINNGDTGLVARTSINDNFTELYNGVLVNKLYQPDGTNPFVYTDNGGVLHIDGDIVQSGTSYETHIEQLYTKKDLIITRDGAVGGLGPDEYTGIEANLYDGTNSGQLVFDKDGWARVGDVGNLQKLATIEETSIDQGFAFYDNATSQLQTKALVVGDISGLVSSQWITSGSDIYYNSGNIGAGTQTPDFPFELESSIAGTLLNIKGTGNNSIDATIAGEWNSSLNLISGTAYQSIINLGDIGNETVSRIIHSNVDNSLRIHTITTERIRITDTGNFYIGQTSGTEMLEVANNVKANSFIIR